MPDAASLQPGDDGGRSAPASSAPLNFARVKAMHPKRDGENSKTYRLRMMGIMDAHNRAQQTGDQPTRKVIWSGAKVAPKKKG